MNERGGHLFRQAQTPILRTPGWIFIHLLHARHYAEWEHDDINDYDCVSKCRFTIIVFLPPRNLMPVYLPPPSHTFPKTATCNLLLLL